MALIATSVERGGVARMFFDMLPSDPVPADEKRIARTIAEASASIGRDLRADQQPPPN